MGQPRSFQGSESFQDTIKNPGWKQIRFLKRTIVEKEWTKNHSWPWVFDTAKWNKPHLNQGPLCLSKPTKKTYAYLESQVAAPCQTLHSLTVAGKKNSDWPIQVLLEPAFGFCKGGPGLVVQTYFASKRERHRPRTDLLGTNGDPALR